MPFDIILASASPRRRELLSLIVNSYRVIPSEFDEGLVPKDLEPMDHVIYSAYMKAKDIADKYPEAIVIGADTIVTVRNQILGKPENQGDAARMLQMLSGKTHQVYTGISVIGNGNEYKDCECTDVIFRNLSDELISRYIATGEPMDKAGAYAIQGKGSVLICSINGCYFNVVGLPVYKLSLLLERIGIHPLGG